MEEGRKAWGVGLWGRGTQSPDAPLGASPPRHHQIQETFGQEEAARQGCFNSYHWNQ